MNKYIQNILTIVLALIISNSEDVLYAYNKQVFHSNTPLLSVIYHDMQGNEVERHSRNHSGGMEHEKMTYSFTSQPLTIERIHTSIDGDTLVSRHIEYLYDNADRLTSISHQVNDLPKVTISQVSYDAIGRRLTESAGALTTTYSHDVHGWLTKMENSRFVQELLYASGATPCYNGNISSMLWRGADGISRRYDYRYDGMSRLIGADYSESGRTAISGLTIQGTPDYSTSYSYDLNGNPTLIYRKGISQKYASGSNRQWQYDEIDNLYIDYRGNQVNFTDDSCPWGYYEDAPGYIEESYDDNEYTWDANGNMTKDLNRGISSIQYNRQNQPTRIAYNDRHFENRLYNSLGEKLRTIHTVLVTSATSSSTSTTTLVTENKRDYYGEDLVYRNDTLEMVLTDNGYVDAGGNYHYYVRDYQGNIRQVVDAQGNVIEQNDYYPYGGLFGESASLHSYKYSGKELERMNGLNTYDFHARPYYYPVLQFHSPDILGEKTPWLSPYLYCAGNPIMFIDPTGMEIRIIYPEENQNLDYVVYENGVLEPQKGSVIILSEYVNKVRTDLNVLSQIPGEPSLRLSKLQESEQVLEIEKPQNIIIDKSINKAIAEDKEKRDNGEPTGATIIYDPDSNVAMIKSDNSQTSRPAVVGLAHELLGHGWDYSLGLYLDKTEFRINGVSINEIRAINIENQVREYLKIPKRTSYGGQKIF